LLIEGNLINKQFITDDNDRLEFYSFILDELLACVSNFDPKTNVKFSTYFTACTENRVKNRYTESKQCVKLSQNSRYKIIRFLSLDIDPKCIVENNTDAYYIAKYLNVADLFKTSTVERLQEYLSRLINNSIVCSLSSFNNPESGDESNDSDTVCGAEDIVVSRYSEDKIRKNTEIDEATKFVNAVKRNVDVLAEMMTDAEVHCHKRDNVSKRTKNIMYSRHKTGLRFLLERSGFHFVDGDLIYDGISSTLDDLGIPLNITRERVRQICDKEIKFIKSHFRTPEAFIQAISGSFDREIDRKDFYKRLMK
jgi:DNA-directed RNA polymerase sigma subunit (sigma70/sigma32)